MSTKKKNIFISCDEARHTCDKSQYNEATLREKIMLTLHTLFCTACRKYSANNRKLTKLVSDKKVATMDASDKNELEELFKKELLKSK